MSKATFLATFSPIQSAIKIYGDETGARVQLEIPESEMGEAAKLLLMRGKVLKITVEVVKNSREYGGRLK